MDFQQITIGAVTVLTVGALGGGAMWLSSGKPTYVVEGNFSYPGPCDSGLCVGSFVSAISPAVPAPALDAGFPDNGTLFADASVPDMGTGFPDAKVDAGSIFPDAGFPDASPSIDTGPGAWTSTVGIIEPANLTALTPPGAHLTVNVLPLPAVGQAVCDPQFGTCERRLLAGQSWHEYNQLRALSDDDKMIILYGPAGDHIVYAFPSMTKIVEDSSNTWSAVRWIPNSHKLAFFARTPARLMQYDVDSGVTTTLVTTPYSIAINANPDEQPSEDGQWWSMYVQTSTGSRVILTVNAWTGKIGATRSLDGLYSPTGGGCPLDPQYGKLEPDFIGVTPSGQYLDVQWVRNAAPGSGENCAGLELYDIQTGKYVRRLHLSHNHGDFGVGLDGRDFYLTAGDSPITNGYGATVLEYVDGSPIQALRLFSWPMVPATGGSGFGQTSCRGPHTGVCLTTGKGEWSGGPLNPELGELYAIFLDGHVQRIGHHRSSAMDATGAYSYWEDPKATLSKSGRYVIYTTNWGIGGQRMAFAIDLKPRSP